MTPSQQAAAAINAASHRTQWGRFATRRYLETRGIPAGLYILAATLRAAHHAGL